ncbi:MAG: glycosyltransferase family 39 protein [Bacteroidetes bacterium]|nr:glycosyltransferase family 39 protein [Bacteroidota bacterium]
MVGCSFISLFSANEFSLRLPSALATIVAFFFLFKIIRLYRSTLFALFACVILLPVDGIIGYHVGRTGDFDALLLAFLLGGLYYLLRYVDFEKRKDIYWVTLFWGLAFMTKGPASAVLIPGIVLYLLFTNRLKSFIKTKAVWQAVGIALLFPIAWFLTVHFYGIQLENPQYAGDNAFERMFLYDLVERFTKPDFEGQDNPTFITYLYICFTHIYEIWQYALYAFVLVGLGYLVKDRKHVRQWFLKPDNRLLLLSICIWVSLGFFLSLVTAAKWWYMAPALPFVAITTFYGFHWLYRKSTYTFFIYIALLVFSFGERFFTSFQDTDAPEFVTNVCEVLKEADKVVYVGELAEQNHLLYLYFCNPEISFEKDFRSTTSNNKPVFILKKDAILQDPNLLNTFQKVGSDDQFTLLR